MRKKAGFTYKGMKFPKTKKRGKGSKKGKKSRKKAGSRTAEKKKALETITQQVKKIKEKNKKKKEKELKKPTSADRERLNNAIREAQEAKENEEELHRRIEEIKNDPNLNKRQKARMMLQLRT